MNEPTRHQQDDDSEQKQLSVTNKSYANSGNVHVLQQVPESATRILDVGCGTGDNASALKRGDRTIVGITLSDAEAQLARQHCDAVHIHNLESGLPQEVKRLKFDVVICSHVLEHICFPQILLNDLRDCLTPSGRLIVALPNLLWYRNRINLMLGRFEYTEHGLMDYTHFRWYTFQSAKSLLKDSGLEVKTSHTTGHIPIGPLRRLIPESLMKPFDTMACRTLPGLMGYQLVYVATTAAGVTEEAANLKAA